VFKSKWSRYALVFVAGAVLAVVGMYFYAQRAVADAKRTELGLIIQQRKVDADLQAANTRLTQSLAQTTSDLADANGHIKTLGNQLAQSRSFGESAARQLAGYQQRDKQLSQLVGSIVADAAASAKLSDSGIELDRAIYDGLRKLAIATGATEADIRKAVGE
jgi:hypothetical protein